MYRLTCRMGRHRYRYRSPRRPSPRGISAVFCRRVLSITDIDNQKPIGYRTILSAPRSRPSVSEVFFDPWPSKWPSFQHEIAVDSLLMPPAFERKLAVVPPL